MISRPAPIGVALPISARSVIDVRSRQPESRATSRSGSLDFPRRVVRDVHRKIFARASQRRHSYASKWLAPGDPLILTCTAGDDMRSTVHLRLGLVEVPSIESRENLVAIAVGEHAGSVNVFLFSGCDVQCHTTCGHLVQHLLTLRVLRRSDRL